MSDDAAKDPERGAQETATSPPNPSSAASPVGAPVAVRSGASSAKQITALVKKNMRIHMRTNACPCCSCLGPCCDSTAGCVPINACCLHMLCPIIFMVLVTALPFYIIKASISDENEMKEFTEPQTIQPVLMKDWPGFGNYDDDTYWGRKLYGAASGYGRDDGLPRQRPFFDSLFERQLSDPEWNWRDSKCFARSSSCYCKTLALVGPDSTVSAFKDLLESEFSSWQADQQQAVNRNPMFNESKVRHQQRGVDGYQPYSTWELQEIVAQAQPGRRLMNRSAVTAAAETRNVVKGVGKIATQSAERVREAASAAVRRLQRRGPKSSTGGSGDPLNPDSVDDCYDHEVDSKAHESVFCHVEAGRNRPYFRKFGSLDEVNKWIDSEEYGRYSYDRSETSSMDRLCGAVIFENDWKTAAEPSYTIRLNVSGTIEDEVGGWLTDVEITFGEWYRGAEALSWYYSSPFFALQHLAHKMLSQPNFRAQDNHDRTDINAYPQFIPLPTDQGMSWAFGEIVGQVIGNPFIMAPMFGPIVTSIAFYMSRERATRQRELMRMMGLSDAALMWSWVIMYATINFIITFFCTVCLQVFCFQKSDFFMMWMAFWWFTNALLTAGMAVSAFVSSERMAAMVAFALLLSTAFVWLSVGEYDSTTKKALISLLPPDGLMATMTAYWMWEMSGTGNSLSNSGSNIANFNVGLGIWMLFVDFWLYLIIYYYFDQIAWWHSVGVSRKPWFCFTPAFWRELMGKPPLVDGVSGNEGEEMARQVSGSFFEDEDDAHYAQMRQTDKCVTIKNLKKVFTNAAGQKFVAVNNLSLTMYQDECFCLLGHNGAGKTTTMMMLTGCMPQSAGSIKVKGCDIPEQIRAIRTSMGFCPQHNVLIDELTVFEHLCLFGEIGGMTHDHIKKRGESLLAAVALLDKMHARSSALSGGMKRKLSCALAFLAEPYLVILDEPSSGMDPFARRGMWDTLKQWRTGHILCLTTHYMDEADALGDRIGIMSQGGLACCGSATFLKRKFGCGYVIAFAKKDERGSQDSEILHFVRGTVGTDAEVMSSVGRELLVQVPFTVAVKFPELFAAIDKAKDQLGIDSYGTSVTNLEEVFLRVGKMEREAKRSQSKPDVGEKGQLKEDEETGSLQPASMGHQIVALLIRRFKFGYRNRISCACQVGLPMLCLFAFCLLIFLTSVHALPALLLDTTKWNVDVDSSDRTPIYVGSVDPSVGATVRSLWSNPPDFDKVEFVDVGSSSRALAGWHEEAAFMQQVHGARDSLEASIYAGILYPDESAWCPASSAICPAMPGPTIAVNFSAVHAGPVVFNNYASVSLAKRTARKPNPITDIKLTNHPFQKTIQQRSETQFVAGIFASLIIMASYGFIPSGVTSYVVMEKEKDVKNQLIISGCSYPAYWISNLIFDVLWGLPPVIGALVTFAIFGLESYINTPGVEASIALFLMYLPAMAGWAYLFSFLFSKAGVALFVAWIVNMLSGILLTIIIFILRSIPTTYKTMKILRWFFRFIPIFNLGYGHLTISWQQELAEKQNVGPLAGLGVGGTECTPREEIEGMDYIEDYFCRYMVGDEFLMLVLSSFFFVAVTVVLDMVIDLPVLKQKLGLSARKVMNSAVQESLEDEMVEQEKERVNGLDPAKQFVYVNDIHKVYTARGTVHAVRGISFAAAEGQVFGLLGVNGAGKTSTFKMLCGQVEPTAGSVCIQGYDVTVRASEARKFIGYCPQFDALLDSLTTLEHLYLYGRIKGLSEADLKKAVPQAMQDLDLTAYHSSRAGQLSGGNKRKLSVAMATIGEPPMVFLDEPSAGMDPIARRGMWSVIQNIADKRKKSVVILTTHSMEEAEALCSRIAIQVDGQFRCLGSAQQIKSKYGAGLELNVRLATPTPQELSECCAKLGYNADSVVNTQELGIAKISSEYGEDVAQDLAGRPGSPFSANAGSIWQAAVVAEWTLLAVRTRKLEKFVLQNFGPEAGDEPCLLALEKSQNVLRYQITVAALRGKFRSLGVVFNTFQEQKAMLQLEDFQICQTSLEQIFNKFATTQASQSAAGGRAAASPPPQQQTETEQQQQLTQPPPPVESSEAQPSPEVVGKATPEEPETAPPNSANTATDSL